MLTKQGLMPYAIQRGGGEVQASYYTLRIPLQDPPPDIQDEDVILMTGVHLGGDLALFGRQLKVTAMDDATYSVAHEIRAILERAVPA